MKTYMRLNETEREEISKGLWAGESFSEIADRLDREVSTISREVWSNCRYKRCYRAIKATRQAHETRHRQKQPRELDVNSDLKTYVMNHLKLGWSPEQIAKRLKLDYSLDMNMRISHESIYTYLYCLPKGELKKDLLKYLKRQRKFRHKRTGKYHDRQRIPDLVSISERPKEVEDRIIPGHWEGDLLIGKDQASALGSLVERTSNYLLLVPLSGRDPKTVASAFAKAIRRIPRHLKKTLTYDRGIEMTYHKLFTEKSKIKVYFCDPHSPWQRGTNENTNGLIRWYFPKGTDFNIITRKDIQKTQDLLNGRPRKKLKFLMPNEVIQQLITNPNFALEG